MSKRAERILVSELTPKQKRLLCNGAGPQNCRWLARLIPELCFHDAACQHDVDYWQGNTVLDKFTADGRFFGACFVAAWKAKGWRPRVFVPLSFIYFFAVFFGGWLCFNFRVRLGREHLRWMEQRAEADRHLKGV
jgi:hypothetical protein